MLQYVFDQDAFYTQCRAVYSQYPTDMSAVEAALDRRKAANPNASPFQMKVWIYEQAVHNCTVHLFPACPFFGELDTGRLRNSTTSTFPPQPGLGCWLMKQYPDFIQQYAQWSDHYTAYGVLNGPQFTDASHHYANVETVLQLGLQGIVEKILHRLGDSSLTAHQRDYLTALHAVCIHTIAIAQRFSDEAQRLLETETNPAYRSNLQRVAQTARQVPKRPPESYYEAICAIWFMREVCNALDGLGFAVIAHIDRLLAPYYEADLAAGRLTPEEAQEYMDCFVSMTDARWDLEADLPGGTNADLIIGGCNASGQPVFNDVTRMVIHSFIRYRFANPKLQARVSAAHPQEYFTLLGELAGLGTNVLSILNDRIIIAANCKAGKALEDARLYVAGGCQEICLSNEVNCRAYTYFNLPQMLLGAFFPEKWNAIYAADGFTFKSVSGAADFSSFYAIVMDNIRRLFEMFAQRYNQFGQMWRVINPNLLFSATMPACIEKAADVSEGGAKYNTDTFAVAGVGTLIDGLLAVKSAVYDTGMVTLEALTDAMASDFADDELLRRYLMDKTPKFGRDPDANTFANQVFADLADRMGGMPNSRGGKFDASLFAFYAYDWFKDTTDATPNGRRCGIALSRGCNPSESTSGIDAATLLDAQKYLDYTVFPGGAVTYMDIPLTFSGPNATLFSSLIQAFMENGGSIMDFNVVDRAELLRAKEDPENHKNIVVRVCGYSAYFHTLTSEMQDEIIGRTQR